MPDRYSAVWATPRKAHLLDSRFGNAVAAYVCLVRTADGDGWRLFPASSARISSRKLHASAADAIASMKYMSLADARAALCSPAAVARRHGAKIVESDDGFWRVLDQPETPLWYALFPSEDYAARAYCVLNRLEMTLPDEARETEQISTDAP